MARFSFTPKNTSRALLAAVAAVLASAHAPAVQASSSTLLVAQQSKTATPKNDRSRNPSVHSRKTRASQIAANRRAMQSSIAMYNTLIGYMYLHNSEVDKGFSHLIGSARNIPDSRLFLQAAEIAIRSRNFPVAMQTLKLWRETFPKDPAANAFHLQVLVASGQIAASNQALQTAMTTLEPKQKQQFIHTIPEIYLTSGNPQQSLNAVLPHLQKATQQADTAFIAASALARMQMAAKQYPQALQSLQLAAQSTPPKEKLGALPNKELPGLIAMDLMHASHISDKTTSQQAQALIQKTMRKPDTSLEFKLAYVRALDRTKSFNESLRHVKRLHKQHPDNALAWAMQGATLMELKRWKEAQESLQQYLALRQKSETNNSAHIKEAQENNNEADNQAISDISAVALRDLHVYQLLIRVADELNEPQQAESWLQRIAPEETKRLAMLQRAEWLLQNNRLEQAIAQVERTSAQTPEQTAQKTLLLAMVYEKQDSPQKAVDLLTAALQNDRDNPELLYARGNMYEQAGKHEESERDLRKVMEMHPDSPLAYNALGYQLADRNVRLHEARELIEKALKLAPDNGAIQDSMGWVEYRLGNLKRARDLLQKAYQTEPQAEIAAHYGEVLWMLNERRQAQKIWKEGLKIDANDKVLQETMRRLAK